METYVREVITENLVKGKSSEALVKRITSLKKKQFEKNFHKQFTPDKSINELQTRITKNFRNQPTSSAGYDLRDPVLIQKVKKMGDPPTIKVECPQIEGENNPRFAKKLTKDEYRHALGNLKKCIPRK